MMVPAVELHGASTEADAYQRKEKDADTDCGIPRIAEKSLDVQLLSLDPVLVARHVQGLPLLRRTAP